MEAIAAAGWATVIVLVWIWSHQRKEIRFLNTVIFGMVTGKLDVKKVEVDSDSVSE